MSTDEELSFILSVEDRMTSEAGEAQEALENVVAGPYEGDVVFTAKLDDEASEGLSNVSVAAEDAVASGEALVESYALATESVAAAGASASETEGQLAGMSDGAADLAQDVENAGQAAQQASVELDQLAQSNVLAGESFQENASAAQESSDTLGQAGSAATIVGVGAQGAAVSGRALTGVMRNLGKEAGLSQGALSGFNTASRTGTLASRLFANGAGAAASTLLRFTAYGAVAAAAIGVVATAWKHNMGSIRDIMMTVRLSVASAFKSIERGAIDAGRAVHNFGQEHTVAGAPVRLLEGMIKRVTYDLGRLTAALGAEGREHNQITAAIERNKAAQDRLKASTDSLRQATDSYTQAARSMEDAQTRESRAGDAGTRAAIGLERAKQRVSAAQANLDRLYSAGISTGEEYNSAVLDMQEAQLGLKDAGAEVKDAAKEQGRAWQDAQGAAEDLDGATKNVNDAYQENKGASDEMTASTQALADKYAYLAEQAAYMRTQNGDAWAAMAADVEAQAARIKAAQDQIDPTLRRSPSLVDKVVSGVDEIANQYKRLGGIAASASPGPIAHRFEPKSAPVAAPMGRVDIGVTLNEGRLEGLIELTVRKNLEALGVSADRDSRIKFTPRFA